jgi:hypothetical protein
VEEKGYKRMINLPDWLNMLNIFIKFKNSGKTGGIFLFIMGIFFLPDKDDKRGICCDITFDVRAIQATVKTLNNNFFFIFCSLLTLS